MQPSSSAGRVHHGGGTESASLLPGTALLQGRLLAPAVCPAHSPASTGRLPRLPPGQPSCCSPAAPAASSPASSSPADLDPGGRAMRWKVTVSGASPTTTSSTSLRRAAAGPEEGGLPISSRQRWRHAAGGANSGEKGCACCITAREPARPPKMRRARLCRLRRAACFEAATQLQQALRPGTEANVLHAKGWPGRSALPQNVAARQLGITRQEEGGEGGGRGGCGCAHLFVLAPT